MSNLILQLSKSKSAFKNVTKNIQKQVVKIGQESTEGILGKIPDCIESVAELMLFDSNINVYEDSNVVFQEFDFRTRQAKPDPKSKKKR